MRPLDILSLLAAVLGVAPGVRAMVEECPSSCSPVNNNYGPACASIESKTGKTYWTFPNLCELFKHRCFNKRFGGPAIEFVSDGACTRAKKTTECQVMCSPDNNKFGSVCASINNSFRTYPNLCMMLKDKCTNERSGLPKIKYLRDGSCSIPLRNDGLEGGASSVQSRVTEKHQLAYERLAMEDPTENDAQYFEDPRDGV